MNMNFTSLVSAQSAIIDPNSARGGSDMAKKITDGTVELNDIPIILLDFIDLVSKWAGTIAVIMLVFGGLKLIASGITEDKEGAKNTIKWALIGLIVALCAWLIVNGIQAFLTR